MLVKRATDRMTSQRLSHLLAVAITRHVPTNGESVTCSLRTSSANPFWGRRRIRGELLKLGVEVRQAAIGR
jgi:hypothetical protein